MSLTTSTIVDKIWRRLERRPDPGDIEQWINGGLQRLCRQSLTAVWRPELETEISLTLSSADAYGVQSVALGSTYLHESIPLINSVRHSDLAAVGPLLLRQSYSDLLPSFILSDSVFGYYCVQDGKLYARRPSASLATTASALKVKAVSILTAVTAVPAGLEGVFEDLLILSAPDYTKLALAAEAQKEQAA